MKYIKQLPVILGISFAGELLKMILPLPIPGSIYGMVLLFLGLLTGIVPLGAVRETGKFLVEIMPILFIPAGVGLMTSIGTLQTMLIPVIVILIVTLVAVMAVTGRVSQAIIRRSEKEVKGDE